MCGIAGIVDSSGAGIEKGLLEAMAARMEHRGPDDQGIFLSDNECGARCGFAFRRLSIIDLSSGHQPMASEDGRVTLIFNGEIYNYRELRAELEKEGTKFRTNSDTESILHLYQRYGIEDCLKKLRGMFAFALWDSKDGALYVARDRTGQKPLVYCEREGKLSFASELAPLLEDKTIRPVVDWESIFHYLTFMCVPAPRTAFKGVKKLPPAHYLVYRGGKLTVSRYWRLDYRKKIKIDREAACERIRELILESTRLRMISDVPLGAFLSGGIDSSSIVAAMSMASLDGSPVRTFSIGFAEEKFNELPFARMVAEQYGTVHEEFMVEPNALEILPMLVEHYGEPYADSSAIPTYYLSKMTRRHVTVALNGDGGDESFSGYGRHYAMRLAEKLHQVPGGVLRLAANGFGALEKKSDRHSLPNRAKRFLEAAGLERHQRYVRWMGFFEDVDKCDLLSREALELAGDADSEELMMELFSEEPGLDPLDSILRADAEFYLPNDLLVKVDIATMANSLEGRSPFLDHRLMEFAASLEPSLKLPGRNLKGLLKEAVSPWLSRDILEKPKWGFAVPIGQWFRGEMSDFLKDNLLGGSRSGFFEKGKVESLIAEHQHGGRDLAHHLWILLMFELWHERFF